MVFRLPLLFLFVSLTAKIHVAHAQAYTNQAFVDTLYAKTWRPQYVMPGANPADNTAFKYTYLTFAELVRWQERGTPIRAIEINANVAKRGGWHHLTKLRDLESITVPLSSTLSLDSLMMAAAKLPVKKITFTNNYEPTPPNYDFTRGSQPTALPAIPVSISQLTHLVTVNSWVGRLDLPVSLHRLAAVSSLRELSLGDIGRLETTDKTNQLPAELGELTQLTGLSLSLQTNKPLGFDAIRKLINLERLTLLSYGPPIPELERQTVGTTLLALSKLRDLMIRADWVPADFKPNWQQLRRLSLSGEMNGSAPGVNKPALRVQTGPMPLLEDLMLNQVQLPDELCESRKLTRLSIADNSLTELPACIGQWSALQSLFISGKALKQIPPAISQLTSLTNLGISQTSLDSIPDVLAAMSQLKMLMITNNPMLRSLPASVTSLNRLENLNVSYNKLTRLPDDLGKLSRLQGLMIDGNKLTQLPEGLTKLTELQRISTGSNQLMQLPANMSRLKKLKQLDLSGNALTVLPGDITRLDSLRQLGLRNNKLTSLPTELGRLRRLQNLEIDRNQLGQLPQSIGELTQLTHLTISDNPITDLPAGIGNLTALSGLTLNRTKVRMLPSSIGNLRELTQLNISNSELMTLPAEIGQCSELTSIRLDNNPIIGLPASIGRLKKLTNLSIIGLQDGMAKLIDLPDSLRFCSGLLWVQLRNLPNLAANETVATLYQLPVLNMLEIAQTPLNQLPATGWKESNISQLMLPQNALTQLPPALLDAPKLQTVSLYGNPLPKSVAGSFGHIDQLRVAMAEAGWVTLDNLPAKSAPIAQGFIRAAMQKAAMRDWSGVDEDMEKAMKYAPDSTIATVYGQRADFYFFRKQYANALTDFEKALANWPALKLPVVFRGATANEGPKRQIQLIWWMRKAMARQQMGQVDAALADIQQAVGLLQPNLVEQAGMGQDQRMAAQTEAQLFTEQGKLLGLKSRFTDADSSFRRAMRAYEYIQFPDPGSRLTIVELGIVTGQYARARKALEPFLQQARDNGLGYGTLSEYLNQALNVAEGTTTGPDALQALKKYISNSSDKIINWSFELFDTWLNRTTLPAEKRDVLKELTTLAKERQMIRE